MRIRGAILGLLTDGVAALGFAVAWGLAWQQCAPPSPLCALPGAGCIAVCSDGWAQFPTNAGFGLVLGLIPAVLVSVATQPVRQPSPGPRTRLHRSLGLLVAGAILASLGVDLLFLSWRSFEGNIAGWAILALAGVAYLAGIILRYRRSEERSD